MRNMLDLEISLIFKKCVKFQRISKKSPRRKQARGNGEGSLHVFGVADA